MRSIARRLAFSVLGAAAMAPALAAQEAPSYVEAWKNANAK